MIAEVVFENVLKSTSKNDNGYARVSTIDQELFDATEVKRFYKEERLGPTAIAARLGIGRASVYRLLPK